MKTKYLLMLPVISFSASTSLCGQKLNDVPAAKKIDLTAEFKESNPFNEISDKMAKMITAETKKSGLDIDEKAMLNALGLDTVTSYAMSSKKEDTQWKNLMFLHNNGSDKGIFSLLGKKEVGFSAPSMCPAGSDLVMQIDLDLRTFEDLVRNINKASNSPEQQQASEDAMKEEIPELGMNVSETFGKLNVRVNIAMNIDENVRLAFPMVGELQKPRTTVRIDGLTWLWDKLGDRMIADSDMDFEKKESDGLITYKLPQKTAIQFMGYALTIAIDKNKDQIWISSSPEFLNLCMKGENTLADSAIFKETLNGFSQKGNAMVYISQEFVELLIKLYGIAEANDMLKLLGDTKADIDKMVVDLKLIKKARVATLTRTNDGILYSERSLKNYNQRIKEFEKLFQRIIENKENPK